MMKILRSRRIVIVFLGIGMLLCPGVSRGQAPAPERRGKLPPLETIQFAHTLFVQGDYEGAQKYYLEVLPQFPKSFDILKNLAYCYYVKGSKGMAQAAEYYRRAYDVNPASQEVAEKLARCYVELRRFAEAAALLRKVAQAPGAPAEAWRTLAETYDAAQNFPEAERAYDLYLQRNPGDLAARSNLGVLYSRRKAYAKALEQFRIALSPNPNYPPALVGMARMLAWEGQYEESLKLYDRVLLLNPNNGDAESGKGFVILWMKRPEEALAIFTKLRRRYPRDGDIARGYETAQAALEDRAISAARRSGSNAPAEAYYRQRLASNPNDLDALKALAGYSADTSRCGESIEYCRKALEIAPDDRSLELLIARSLALCQQYAEAIVRYNRFLGTNPKAEDALAELGTLYVRTRRFPEAIETFRKILTLNPEHTDARVGLAQALAGTGSYQEALLRYDEVLKKSPEHYDALQGKGFVLFWNGDLAQARAIFQELAAKKPNDPQNPEALENIARAEEEARWAALRPAPDAPPQAFLAYYEKRLASHPEDRAAMMALASLQEQLKNLPEAIQSYRRVVEKFPVDRDAKMELARLLSWQGKYDESLQLYGAVLKDSPDDPEVLENLARLNSWAGHPQDALQIYQKLLARSPSNTGYQLEVARLEIRMKDFPAAREVLASLLSTDPNNREARLQFAQLELNQGNRESSIREFDQLLRQNPKDVEALFGKAQVSYYQGELRQARETAMTLVAARPNNFDAILLLATIEHARQNRKQSLQLLNQAAQLNPGNPEVTAMKKRIKEEATVTVHTSASYAREIGAPGQFVLKDTVPDSLRPTIEAVIGPLENISPKTGLPNQDLRLSSYGTTIGFSLLPRTDSYLSFTELPSQSPAGPLRDDLGNQIPTGLTGAVAPSQFLYRQTTRLSPHFTLRGGVGLVRFGPGTTTLLGIQRTGDLRVISEVFGADVLDASIRNAMLPDQTATLRPIGQGGFTFAPTKKFSFDLDVTRSAIAYTPVAARDGVIEERFDGGLNFFFTPRTDLHLDYFYGHYSSEVFRHYDLTGINIARLPGTCVDVPLSQCLLVTGQLTTEARSDHDQAHGGSALFNRNLIRSDRFSFDAGYSGLAYGFAGRRRRVFMGFFNPSFYQRHLLTARFYGKLAGPLSYDISGGVGLQQTEQGNALTRGVNVSPSFTVRVSNRLSVSFGYSHYNTAQSLGTLRGNAFRVSTDWRF